MGNAIETVGLRKVYRIGSERIVALDRVDLTIGEGEICCVLGTSGSGKSTLLNMLAGLEKPTKGKITIFGHDFTKLNENKLVLFRQRYMGFVFQSYNLIGSQTALENVTLPLMFKGVSRKLRNKAAKSMLKAVGLGGRMKHRPSQMSGGQQQRVGIARAFVARPRLIFADEPTGNLDTRTSEEVMSLMVRMCREKGSTLIIVSHDEYVAKYADRILTIVDGNIVSDKPNVSIVPPVAADGDPQLAPSPESASAPAAPSAAAPV